jgi:hypothetical protein
MAVVVTIEQAPPSRELWNWVLLLLQRPLERCCGFTA